MDRRLTAYVLKYLLEHRFESKAEMARQLGMRQRTIEKVFANLDVAKAGMVPQRKYMATMHSVVPQRRFMGAGGSVLLQRRDVGSRLTATNDKVPLPDTGGGSLIPTQGGFFHEGLFH